jgi:dihydropteroate synthase
MTNEFPKIMGILNVTPDSFSDGGRFSTSKEAIEYAENMIDKGVDILDIGGESTRPGSENVSVEEERQRVIPIIKEIKKTFPRSIISIDTTKYEVAASAVEEGAEIINDVSALRFSPKIAELVASKDLSVILMHMQGNPKTMQNQPKYNNVVQEVYDFLQDRIEYARNNGINKIYGDIGIGFGKTLDHNIELLRNISFFHSLGVPLVLGISRKSFLGKLLNIDNPLDRDIPTALMHSLLLDKGIDIIRVHNIDNIQYLKKLYNIFRKQ